MTRWGYYPLWLEWGIGDVKSVFYINYRPWWGPVPLSEWAERNAEAHRERARAAGFSGLKQWADSVKGEYLVLVRAATMWPLRFSPRNTVEPPYVIPERFFREILERFSENPFQLWIGPPGGGKTSVAEWLGQTLAPLTFIKVQAPSLHSKHYGVDRTVVLDSYHFTLVDEIHTIAIEAPLTEAHHHGYYQRETFAKVQGWLDRALADWRLVVATSNAKPDYFSKAMVNRFSVIQWGIPDEAWIEATRVVGWPVRNPKGMGFRAVQRGTWADVKEYPPLEVKVDEGAFRRWPELEWLKEPKAWSVVIRPVDRPVTYTANEGLLVCIARALGHIFRRKVLHITSGGGVDYVLYYDNPIVVLRMGVDDPISLAARCACTVLTEDTRRSVPLDMRYIVYKVARLASPDMRDEEVRQVLARAAAGALCPT